MKITRNQLRQIIRSTLLQESIGKTEYNSYFLLKRVVDWALRNKMGMSGNAQLGDRESSWNEMTQQRYGKLFVVPPIELYDAVRARLLASPKVSAVSMDVEMGGEMSGAFSVGVYGIPGWPSPMTHDDFYQAAQFIKRNPAMADLVAAYEADFGDDSDPEPPVSGGDLMEFAGDAPRDDREDRPFELSRGMVFMIIDLILNSAPKGNTSFLINDVDMEIMVFKPSHPVPAGMTMGRLLAGGGMRDTGARRAPDRLSIATPDAVSDDDVNESRRHNMRITKSSLRQIIREELLRETQHRFPINRGSGAGSLRGKGVDIVHDFGSKRLLDPDYNERDDFSRFAGVMDAPPGAPSDTLGYRDQEADVLSLDTKEVAESMLNDWGYEDTVHTLSCLMNPEPTEQGEEDQEAAHELMQDLLSHFNVKLDPVNRDLSPAEQHWYAKVLGDVNRLGRRGAGMPGYRDTRTVVVNPGWLDDINESSRRDVRITKSSLRQLIHDEARRALNEGVVDGRTEMLGNALAKLSYVEHYLLSAKRAEQEEGLEVDPALDDLIERFNSCGADLVRLIRRTRPRPVRDLREAYRDSEEGTGYEYLRDMPDTVQLVDGPVDEKWLNKRLNHFRDFPPRMLPMVLIDFVRMLKGEPVGADVVEVYTNRDGTSNVTRQTIEALVDELLGPSWRD